LHHGRHALQQLHRRGHRPHPGRPARPGSDRLPPHAAVAGRRGLPPLRLPRGDEGHPRPEELTMTTTEHASATSPGDTPAPPGAAVDLDISARSFWAKPFEEREQTFAWLRANEPVSYHRPYESTLVPPEPDSPGFWALTKHEDCQLVSRNQEDFTVTQGVIMED